MFCTFVFDGSSLFDFAQEKEKFTHPIFILNAILFIISSLGYNVFVMLITQNFGATNRVVVDFVSYFFSLIIDSISQVKEEGNVIMLLFFGYFFVLVGTVGFNEIIIFSCCKLNYNTAIEINKRASIYGEIMDLKSHHLVQEFKNEEFSIDN